MDSLQPYKAKAIAQITHAVPISTDSFLLGFETHSYWWPRMQVFRRCMAERYRLSVTNRQLPFLPEELIRAIEKIMRDAGREYAAEQLEKWNARKETAVVRAEELRALAVENAAQQAARRLHESPDIPQGRGMVKMSSVPSERSKPGLEVRYMAAVFNLTVVPTSHGTSGYPDHLYLCLTWWPNNTRRALDMQRWCLEKDARPESPNLFNHFGWAAKYTGGESAADDRAAEVPSLSKILRINNAIQKMGLDVVYVGRSGKSLIKHVGNGNPIRLPAEDSESFGKRREEYARQRDEAETPHLWRTRIAAIGNKENIIIACVEDPRTGKSLWKPRRLFMGQVEQFDWDEAPSDR